MISYKDRTYCPYWNQCSKGNKCDRALTKKVEVEARKAKLLISQFAGKPDCFERK